MSKRSTNREYVYLVSGRYQPGVTKIGFSGDLEKRMYNLGDGLPGLQLDILWTHPDGVRSLESRLKESALEAYPGTYLQRECFLLEPDQIAELAGPLGAQVETRERIRWACQIADPCHDYELDGDLLVATRSAKHGNDFTARLCRLEDAFEQRMEVEQRMLWVTNSTTAEEPYAIIFPAEMPPNTRCLGHLSRALGVTTKVASVPPD